MLYVSGVWSTSRAGFVRQGALSLAVILGWILLGWILSSSAIAGTPTGPRAHGLSREEITVDGRFRVSFESDQIKLEKLVEGSHVSGAWEVLQTLKNSQGLPFGKVRLLQFSNAVAGRTEYRAFVGHESGAITGLTWTSNSFVRLSEIQRSGLRPLKGKPLELFYVPETKKLIVMEAYQNESNSADGALDPTELVDSRGPVDVGADSLGSALTKIVDPKFKSRASDEVYVYSEEMGEWKRTLCSQALDIGAPRALFSPTGDYLLVPGSKAIVGLGEGSSEKETQNLVNLVNLKSGETHVVYGDVAREVTRVIFAPDGSKVAFAGRRFAPPAAPLPFVDVLHLADGGMQLTSVMEGSSVDVFSHSGVVEFSRDGKSMVTLSDAPGKEKTLISIWDVQRPGMFTSKTFGLPSEFRPPLRAFFGSSGKTLLLVNDGLTGAHALKLEGDKLQLRALRLGNDSWIRGVPRYSFDAEASRSEIAIWFRGGSFAMTLEDFMASRNLKESQDSEPAPEDHNSYSVFSMLEKKPEKIEPKAKNEQGDSEQRAPASVEKVEAAKLEPPEVTDLNLRKSRGWLDLVQETSPVMATTNKVTVIRPRELGIRPRILALKPSSS